jgi:hypothetical protein
MKKPYYVGEVIGANLGLKWVLHPAMSIPSAGYQLYDVISVEKTTWQVPKGWVVVIKSRSDGEHHEFYGPNVHVWDLIQPVEERLWNL